MRRAACAGIALLAASLLPAGQTAAQWRPLGLDDQRVECVLQAGNGMVLAGTQTGLYVYAYDQWSRVNLPSGFSRHAPAVSTVNVRSRPTVSGPGWEIRGRG